MGAVGAMVLAGGAVQGRQIVPKAWIADSITPHVGTGAGGYGYQFWTSTLDWNGKALPISTYTQNFLDHLDRLKLDIGRVISIHYPADNRVVTLGELTRWVGR